MLQLFHFSLAKDDCDSALKLELNVKALLRRGMANLGLQEFADAQRDFLHVLQLEPNNRCAGSRCLLLPSVASCMGCSSCLMWVRL